MSHHPLSPLESPLTPRLSTGQASGVFINSPQIQLVGLFVRRVSLSSPGVYPFQRFTTTPLAASRPRSAFPLPRQARPGFRSRSRESEARSTGTVALGSSSHHRHSYPSFALSRKRSDESPAFARDGTFLVSTRFIAAPPGSRA